MSTATLIKVEEYLATSYRPDCDLVDGVLLDRNVGQKDHSKLQREVLVWFANRRRALRLAAFPEQRLLVGPGRYRVPDVCVVRLPEPEEQVFTDPPYICVEVLSLDDSFLKLQSRFDDYVDMGVANIWVLDPATRRGWYIRKEGHLESLDRVLRSEDGQVSLAISELFPSDAD